MRDGMLFGSFKELRTAVADARREAHEECRNQYSWVRGRGTWLATVDADGTQCDPHPRAECPDWDGTLRDINREIDLVLREYPGVAEITICGGFDGGDQIQDFRDGMYEPWVSFWDVVIWKRGAA